MDANGFQFLCKVLFLVYAGALIYLSSAAIDYQSLYQKKKKPEFPIDPFDPQSLYEYVSKKPENLLKFYFIMPFFLWKILFETHKDKELNDLANEVRFRLILTFGLGLLSIYSLGLSFWLNRS